MMPISLPPELAEFVEKELASGRYTSEDQLINEAVRLLRRQKLYTLQSAIKVGLDELERGEGIDLQDDTALAAFFEDIEAEVEGEQEVE